MTTSPERQVGFSVVIPTFNRPALTARAVASVYAAADDRPFEVIVVDDGSDDRDALTTALAPFPETLLIFKPEQTNAADSRNIGIRRARHDFIFLLDSDDTFHPGHVAHRIEMMLATGSGIAFGDYVTQTNQREVRSDLPPYSGGDIRDYIFRDGGSTLSSTISIYRPRYKGTSFDADLRKHQDWAFMIAASDRNEIVGFDPAPNVTISHDDPNRMSFHLNVPATKVFLEKYVAGVDHRNGFLLLHLKNGVMVEDHQAVADLYHLLDLSRLQTSDRLLARFIGIAARLRLFSPIRALVLLRARLRRRWTG